MVEKNWTETSIDVVDCVICGFDHESDRGRAGAGYADVYWCPDCSDWITYAEAMGL